MKAKVIIPTLLALLLFGSMAYVLASKKSDNTMEDPGNQISLIEGGPLIQWEKDLLDLGKIPQNVPVQMTFDFTNVGDAPITVENVKKSCGCTETKWVEGVVAPGSKGWVGATFNAKATGVFSKSITVYSNDKSHPISVLYFKGEVVAGGSEEGEKAPEAEGNS